ncbi:MAG: hypothetical protein ABR886_06165 [Dehalococcoidales bacterium]|jgi:hypothetical protein
MKPNKTEDLMYYWVRFRNGKKGISDSKIAEVRILEDNPEKPDYYLLRGKTIKHWNKMNITAKQISVNMDTLVLSASKGRPQSEIDKLIKNITDAISG